MGKKVLVCDDMAGLRMMEKDILIKNGYEVCGEAENGLRAVEMYPELKPDLVLMDVTMPEMDGIQALKEIMAYDGDAKVVMCSSMADPATVSECMQAGAKDFIEKTFREEPILRTLEKVLG